MEVALVVGVPEVDALDEGLPEALSEGYVGKADTEAVFETEPEALLVADALLVAEDVGARVGVAGTDGDVLAVPEGERDGEGVADSEALTVPERDGSGVTDPDAVAVPD